MTIQILHYEFLGPIKLSEWGPPMEEVVYVIFVRQKDRFNIVYVEESAKTEKTDFFTQNPKFKCWIDQVGSENNLYLAIHPMWNSDSNARKIIVNKIISKYKPACNDNSSSHEPQDLRDSFPKTKHTVESDNVQEPDSKFTSKDKPSSNQ